MNKYYEHEITNLSSPYTIKVAYNQKVVQIHRVEGGINFKANYKALATLSQYGYSLYMYLLLHEEGRVWALSSKDVYAKTQLTEKTYPKAVKDLIDKGYLVQGKIDGGVVEFEDNAYHLWEDPANKVTNKKVKLDNKTKTKAVFVTNGKELSLSDEVF